MVILLVEIIHNMYFYGYFTGSTQNNTRLIKSIQNGYVYGKNK